MNDSERYCEFPHYEPDSSTTYFLDRNQLSSRGLPLPGTPLSTRLSVLIPMYNEPKTDLLRTLLSLHENLLEVIKSDPCLDINVLVVLDGWKYTHETVKSYLLDLFPFSGPSLHAFESNPAPVLTCILQRTKYGRPTFVSIAPYTSLKISFLVKKDNRRKHNSHDWFLSKFAREMESNYIYLTDCGTLYHRKCLGNLYRAIKNDPNCAGVAGRQRVMTAKQQLGPEKTDSFYEGMLRAVQCFDYESCLSCFQLPFSVAGCLAVIPGPNGLFNYELLSRKPVPKSSHLLLPSAPPIPPIPPLILPPGFQTSLHTGQSSLHTVPSTTSLGTNTNNIPRCISSSTLDSTNDDSQLSFSRSDSPSQIIPHPPATHKPIAPKHFIFHPKASHPVIMEQKKEDIHMDIHPEFNPKPSAPPLSLSLPTPTAEEQDSPIDFYLKAVKRNPEEVGMVEANLMLAEDRILSYSWMKSQEKCYTKYVWDAVFYFEAETDPKQLLQQRRRWINGTIAGYIWLLNHLSLVWNSHLMFSQKLLFVWLIFSQIMMYVVMTLGVAIITIGMRFILVSTFMLDDVLTAIVIFLYLGMYVGFVLLHCFPPVEGQTPRPKLHETYFHVVSVVNALFAALLLITLIIEFGKGMVAMDLPVNSILILINILLPFVLALAHSTTSFWLMVKTCIPFFLFLPTFTVYFSTYAFSRLWELTWGNRPSDRLLTAQNQKSTQELADIKSTLISKAKRVILMICIVNLLFSILFIRIQFQYEFLLVVEFFIFGWTMSQMIMSVIFFFFYTFIHGVQWIWRVFTIQKTSRKKEDFDRICKGKNQALCALKRAQLECEMRNCTAIPSMNK